MNEIKIGSVVKYKNGWYRVSKLTSKNVNLASIFMDRIYHKNIPIGDVVEDYDNWYESWSKSETYMSM